MPLRQEMLRPVSLVLVAGGLGGVFSACARALSRRQHLAPGDPVPDVEARDQDGAPTPLTRYRGHPLVVYFYPKDRTSGCTVEAHGFRAAYADFRALGAEILGVSNDDVGSHRDFCSREALPFPLLADPDQSLARAFGVRSTLGFYQRITFVIDGGGVVRRVFDPVSPGDHAREVLVAVKALTSAAPTSTTAKTTTR